MAKFKEGKSGNPEGRPKGSISITSAIRRKLEEVNPATKRLYVEDLVDVMMDKALKEKDFRVMKEIWNHIDGSPRTTSEDVGDKKLPIPILFDASFRERLGVSNEAVERFGLKD
jgi:hypothetical protein